MDINDILSKQVQTNAIRSQSQPETKRMKVDHSTQYPPSSSLFEMLCNKLYEIKGLHNINHNNIEIEFRVGMLTNNDRRYHHVRKSNLNNNNRIDSECILVTDLIRKSNSGINFQAGIDEYICDNFSTIFGKGIIKPVQKLRFNEQTKLRWEVDESNNVKMKENKARIVRYDVACISYHYDIRLDVNSETTIPLAAPQQNPAFDVNDYSVERIKKRTTYVPSKQCSPIFSEPSCWQVDLTHVDTIDRSTGGANNVSSSMELEIELMEASRDTFFSLRDPAQIIPFVKKLGLQLLTLLHLLLPNVIEYKVIELVSPYSRYNQQPMYNPCMEMIKTELGRINSVLMKSGVNSQIHAHSHSRGLEFIGSMPVNLVRRNFEMLQNNDYYCTEKSDGVRFLMYVVNSVGLGLDIPRSNPISSKKQGQGPSPRAVLVDRALSFSDMKGSEVIGEALGVGTVLDGEVIFHKHLGREVYLIFDILALDGVSVVNRPFAERLGIIKQTIIPRCSAMYWKHMVPHDAVPGPMSFRQQGQCYQQSELHSKASIMVLFAKQFFPKKQITHLLHRFKLVNGSEHVYTMNPISTHADGGTTSTVFDPSLILGMHHKSDGIVFQPNASYKFKTDMSLMKWKWHELCSVDLCARVDSRQITLSAGTSGDGDFVECASQPHDASTKTYTNIPKYDCYRLKADVEEHAASTHHAVHSIAEVTYNPNVGSWNYHHLRHDKTIPNHMRTLMSVLTELADAISIEELEYTLIARTKEENDYPAQISRMKQKAVSFQRERCLKE